MLTLPALLTVIVRESRGYRCVSTVVVAFPARTLTRGSPFNSAAACPFGQGEILTTAPCGEGLMLN